RGVRPRTGVPAFPRSRRGRGRPDRGRVCPGRGPAGVRGGRTGRPARHSFGVHPGGLMIETVLYSDPACPWAYSESPALRVIEWRYGDQVDWKLVLVGLTERSEQYAERGYTPVRGALGQLNFRNRYGMPFSPVPKARLSATARACRAVVAARLANPGSEWAVFRAIQLANFTGPLVLEDDEMLRDVLREVPGVDADAIIAALDSPEVTAAYEADKADTRTAQGSAAELQGKTATTDGPVRFTAPSIVFQSNGTSLVAGGFQPVEAYDI